MDKIRPLPCPFCGCEYTKDKDDFVYAGQHKDWCPLSVKNNGLENLVVDDDPKAIEMWNRRKPDGYLILGTLRRLRKEMVKKERMGIRYCLDRAGMDHLLDLMDKRHQRF